MLGVRLWVEFGWMDERAFVNKVANGVFLIRGAGSHLYTSRKLSSISCRVSSTSSTANSRCCKMRATLNLWRRW